MDELRNKSVNDVEALLDELEKEKVPAMTAEFEAQAMSRIALRKKELDEEEQPVHANRTAGFRWKAWLAAAAAFVFLLGGTLLTRGSFRTDQPDQPDSGKPGIVHPMAIDPLADPQTEEAKEPETQNQIALFFGDMWLFLKAALPWLGGAGALAVAVYLVRKKQKGSRQ